MIRFFLFITILLKFAGIAISQEYEKEPDWYKTYDVKFYYLNLNVYDTTTYISGNAVVKLQIKELTDTIAFDFNKNLVIDSVKIGNQKAGSYNFQSDLLIIRNANVFPVNTVLDVTVYYKGNAGNNSFFSSLTSERENSWNIPVTWTLSEPFGAKFWFPCKQQLTDKADSCWVFLTIPKGRKAGSTGILTDTVNISNDKVQYQWKTKYPIAYYLISFTIADYNDYSFHVQLNGQADSLLVQNFIYNRPNYFETNKVDIDKTTEFLKLYSKLYGLYPFYKEKYGHCVAPIGGGMEHQSMTTLVNFGYTLVSHELAHQWFGDNTTCSSWQDIWVNEGFASYSEYLAYEFLESKAEADSWMKSAQSKALREAEGSVFIPSSEAKDEYRIFSTNLSYKKGAVIIHTLRKQINNDTLFFRSLRTYLSKFRYGNASGEDFKKVMENETGMDLTNFFNQWYYGKGYPQFDISWKYDNDTLLLNLKQTPSSTGTPFFITPFDIRVTGNDYDTTFRLQQITNPQLFKVKIFKEVNSVEFDPDNWLLKIIQNISKLPEIPSNDDYFDIKPNPFNTDIYITFKKDSPKDDKIRIVALNGNIMYEAFVRRKKEFVINTSGISPGIYLLVIQHGQEKFVRKIVKANNLR